MTNDRLKKPIISGALYRKYILTYQRYGSNCSLHSGTKYIWIGDRHINVLVLNHSTTFWKCNDAIELLWDKEVCYWISGKEEFNYYFQEIV